MSASKRETGVASGFLADGTYVRSIAHVKLKDPTETAKEALDSTISFDAKLSRQLAEGVLVEVMKEGEPGIQVIPKKELENFLRKGYVIYHP